ncbi:MAG: hypothetical protein MI919_24060, partial [Holophagales bacterium]|nr:hypothetical protein [Holophagales bacterium]
LDDHGELWSPSQLERVLAVLEEASAHPEGALVNVYVHGWNHDASPANESRETGNVRGQQVLLEQLAASEATFNPERARPVVGVYIAWRGRLLRGPFNFLTFYNRRQAANRVAGITATGTVYRILAAAKRNPKSRVALLGHSFGGLVVERTLSQALVGALFAPGAEERESFELLADLVMLINPASPAIHAKQFVELLERNRLVLYRESPDGVRREMPAVVSITSEGDWATGLFYPAGLRLLATRKTFRDYGEGYCGATAPQRSFAIRTAGHHELLQSHHVTAEPLPESERSTRLTGQRLEEMARWEYDPRTGQPVIVFEGGRHRFRIVRKPRVFNDTPYWIMRVPTSLIPDHSQIFRFDTYRLIGALMVATGAFETSTRTLLLRQDGIRPIGMTPAAGGGMLVLDRSRRIFYVSDFGQEPVLFGCLPAELDPRDGLGFTYENGEYISGSRRRENGDRLTTHFRRVRVAKDRVETVEEIELRTGEEFLSMAADVPGRRVFLIHGDGREVWQADLAQKRPEPERLTGFDGLARLTLLQYQSGRNALFVANGDGFLFRLDLESGERQLLVVGLGRPTALEYDAENHRLYV